MTGQSYAARSPHESCESARIGDEQGRLAPMSRKPWTRNLAPGYDYAADPTIDEKFDQVRDKLMPRGPGSR